MEVTSVILITYTRALRSTLWEPRILTVLRSIDMELQKPRAVNGVNSNIV